MAAFHDGDPGVEEEEEEEEEEIHGWVQLTTEDGKVYYYNPDLGVTQWERPEDEEVQVLEADGDEEGEGEDAGDQVGDAALQEDEDEDEVEDDDDDDEEETPVQAQMDSVEEKSAGGANVSQETGSAGATGSQRATGGAQRISTRRRNSVRKNTRGESKQANGVHTKKCVWEKKHTESIGMDEGEVYYLVSGPVFVRCVLQCAFSSTWPHSASAHSCLVLFVFLSRSPCLPSNRARPRVCCRF